MRHDDTRDDVWALSSSGLASRCREIAEGSLPAEDKALQAEAGRLSVEWRDALSLPNEEFGDQARRTALTLALRKRTIEILLKISQRR